MKIRGQTGRINQMKTLNEIQLAMCRTLMRHGALMYREAISPQFNLDWNYRCKLGVESLLFAVSQRNEARLWEAEAAKEKKLQIFLAPVRQIGSMAADEHTAQTSGAPEKDCVTGWQSPIPRG